jgi:hypothetical protein
MRRSKNRDESEKVFFTGKTLFLLLSLFFPEKRFSVVFLFVD